MKGFVISWFYPPVNSSEGLVTYKLLKSSGLSHDVFTQKDNDNWTYNTTEKKLIAPNVSTIFANSSESFDDWVDECVKYFSKHHEKYDFIMSRSMPPESHLAALRIKQMFPDVKWIASFGDPIHNSPYNAVLRGLPPHRVTHENFVDVSIKYTLSPKRLVKDYIWSRSEKRDKATELKLKNIEQRTMTSADLVIYNNPFQQEFMESTLEQGSSVKKSVIIPHSYDRSLYPKNKITDSSSSKSSTTKIVYLGHLDYVRTPINFLSAVSKLRDKHPDLYSKLDVEFYGNLDNLSKVSIIDNELFDNIKVKKPITYQESLGVMASSDWCLLIDANITQVVQDNIYFAAKLADYIGSGSKIFAITMLRGASADIVRQLGGVVSSHSVDEIYMWLYHILTQVGEDDKQYHHNPKYSSAKVAKEYNKLVHSLIGA